MNQERVRQLRVLLVGTLLAATAVIYVLLPINALHWAQQPFPGFLLDPNLVISDGGEKSWPARQLAAPPAYPERVTAVDGTPVPDKASYNQLLATYSVGDRLTFTLTQPPDSSIIPPRTPERPTRQVTLELFYLSSTDLWNQFWLVYLVGLFFLVVGAWTFAVRPQAEAAQIFALFTALAALTVGCLFDINSSQQFVHIWVVALSLVGSAALLLSLVFPYQPRLLTQRPWLKWLVMLPAVLLALWGQLWLNLGSDPWAYAIPWRYAYLLNGVALLLAIGVTAYRSIASTSALVRQQAQIILAGSILAFFPLIILFLGMALTVKLDWLTQGVYVSPIVLYPLAIGYTIIRYRLLEMNLVLRRGIPAAVALALLVGALALVFNGLSIAFGREVGALSNPLLTAVLMVLLLLLFNPLRDWFQQELDQLLFRQPMALDELLHAYNRDLTTAVTVEQVAHTMLDYVKKALPECVARLYLADERTVCYRETGNEAGLQIPPDSPLVNYLRQEPDIIDLAEEHTWPPALLTSHKQITAMQAAALVPINNGQVLWGWLALSGKGGGRRFRGSELNFLSSLANQSLIALERAQVVRNLEMRLEEQNRLNQFSQTLNFISVLDHLLELVYTTYQRMFHVTSFYIHLHNQETGALYTPFCADGAGGNDEQEGSPQLSQDERLWQVQQTGQMWLEVTNGRSWVMAPLNAGADTLGVLQAELPYALQEADRQLFMTFADRTAVALGRLYTNQQLQKRAQQLEILNQVTFSLTTTRQPDPLLNLILDKAIELLDTEAGTIMLSNEDSGELEFRVVRGPSSQELLGKRLPVGTGLAGRVAQSGRPLIVNRVQEDQRWYSQVDAITAFQSHSILTVPLIRENSVLGVLQVINKRSGAPFTEEDQRLLMAFAGQAVVIMENAYLLQQTDQALQERVNELFLLQQLDRDLNTTLELKRVLSLTLDWALRTCRGTAGVVLLLDENREVTTQVMHGYDPDFELSRAGQKRLTDGLVGKVCRTGKPHISGNVHAEPEYVPGASNTLSQITLPIVYQEKLMGIVAIESDRFNAFTPVIQETAVRLVTHAATAIANAQLYQQVLAANLAKSEFVSMVSHELKTPMTAVRGYTELMLSGMTGPLTPQQQGFLEKIITNIDRMGRQIRDLTDISRIETGRMLITLAPAHFAHIVSETLPSIQTLADAKQIQLNLDFPPDLPLVMVDHERMVQVLTNLLSNACKYSPEGTQVHISLRTDRMLLPGSEATKPVVVCAIRDQGYGISEADQKRLFTKFFRADDPQIRKAAGTGLGLSITKGIIELHGGHIWVESTQGKGTTFFFAIPQAT